MRLLYEATAVSQTKASSPKTEMSILLSILDHYWLCPRADGAPLELVLAILHACQRSCVRFRSTSLANNF
jgi:hypothetical protein